MKEQRSEKRRELFYYLQVYDGVSRLMIGHMANLTKKGLMLVSRDPLNAQEEYRLRIRFPDRIGRRNELLVSAVCRWCRKDVNPETFVAGFQFQDLSGGEHRFISCLGVCRI